MLPKVPGAKGIFRCQIKWQLDEKGLLDLGIYSYFIIVTILI